MLRLDGGYPARRSWAGLRGLQSFSRDQAYLCSGLMVCGACGGGFSKISAGDFGCSTAPNKGPTACGNRLTVRGDLLEQTVRGALRERRMDPALFRESVAVFATTWNRPQAEASAGLMSKRAKLTQLEGQIERAVNAIVAGMASKGRLEELERSKAQLEAELTGPRPLPCGCIRTWRRSPPIGSPSWPACCRQTMPRWRFRPSA